MVLLVVDAQNGIVDERLYEFRKFVGNIKKLIGAAREQGIEVIYVQQSVLLSADWKNKLKTRRWNKL